MRWPPILISLGMIFIMPEVLSAVEPRPSSQATVPGDPSSPPTLRPTLLRQNSSASFQLVLGRLRLDSVRYRKGSQTVQRNATSPFSLGSNSGELSDDDVISETLNVEGCRGVPALHYSSSSRHSLVTIDADGQGTVRMESRYDAVDEDVKIVLVQRPDANIQVETIRSGIKETYQAANWLQLREVNPGLFAMYFEPVIDELLWPYRFRDIADEAHRIALENAGTEQIHAEQVNGWIEGLRSPSRMVRNESEASLRLLGVALLPRLARLDLTLLDTEQRLRIVRIQKQLTPLTEDDAARLSNLIRDDVDYWRLASSRLDAPQLASIDAKFKRMGIPLRSHRKVDPAPTSGTRIASTDSEMRR